MQDLKSGFETGRAIIRISVYVIFAAIIAVSVGYLAGLNYGRVVFYVAVTVIVLSSTYLALKPVISQRYGTSATVALGAAEAIVAAVAIFLIVQSA